jgi:hypothetical protein
VRWAETTGAKNRRLQSLHAYQTLSAGTLMMAGSSTTLVLSQCGHAISVLVKGGLYQQSSRHRRSWSPAS